MLLSENYFISLLASTFKITQACDHHIEISIHDVRHFR